MTKYDGFILFIVTICVLTVNFITVHCHMADNLKQIKLAIQQYSVVERQ